MDEIAKIKSLKDDTSFNKINKFITLQDEHVAKANKWLREITDVLIVIMKKQDELFNYTYQSMMFAGSYYKGTKVGMPEEFDLDLIFKLPLDYTKIQFEQDRPGYSKIKLHPHALKSTWGDYKRLNKWLAGDYLSNDQFRRWFYGILYKSLKTMKQDGPWYILIIPDNSYVRVKSRTSGPAATLSVVGADIQFEIDLVPVLEFMTPPPLTLFKYMKVYRPWYLVPKPLDSGNHPDLSWRYCFYPYEKALLAVHGRIKPIIRHLKKLKDNEKWSSILPSYYIETVILNELKVPEVSENIDKVSMTTLLVYMFTKLKEACKTRNLPYHWDPRHNLLEQKTPQQLMIFNRMEKILKDLQTDNIKLFKYFLTPQERAQLMNSGENSNYSPPQTVQLNADNSWLSWIFNVFRNLSDTNV